jgi:colanic acid/amylovoran biosynthesis protein
LVERIFVTGQLSLQPGRLENGNIGNAYVAIGCFSSLRMAFPEADIRTTLQVSRATCARYAVTTVPVEVFVDPADDSRDALRANHAAWMAEVQRADIVLDVSGDVWGPNASLISPRRFLAASERLFSAMETGVPVALVASSPGPFLEDSDFTRIARELYSGYSVVVNREPASTRHLAEVGFDMSRTRTTACPSWTFKSDVSPAEARMSLGFAEDEPLTAIVPCAWNLSTGAFEDSARPTDDYSVFIDVVEQMARSGVGRVVVVSPSNGFVGDPHRPQLIPGRDAIHVQRILQGVEARGIVGVNGIVGPVDPDTMHAFLGSLSLVIAGRLHAGVAALSGGVPTVCIDYGIGPVNLKSHGFFELMDLADSVVPLNREQITQAADRMLADNSVRLDLLPRHAVVAETAHTTWSHL